MPIQTNIDKVAQDLMTHFISKGIIYIIPFDCDKINVLKLSHLFETVEKALAYCEAYQTLYPEYNEAKALENCCSIFNLPKKGRWFPQVWASIIAREKGHTKFKIARLVEHAPKIEDYIYGGREPYHLLVKRLETTEKLKEYFCSQIIQKHFLELSENQRNIVICEQITLHKRKKLEEKINTFLKTIKYSFKKRIFYSVKCL